MNNKELGGDSELIPAARSAVFSRWHMPAFGEDVANVVQAGSMQREEERPADAQQATEDAGVAVEEVELDEVKPLTLEEVEAIRQDAYNEGFSAGEKDGFHAGQLRAQQEAEAALQPRLQALEQLMQHLFEPIAGQDQAIEHMLLDLVRMVSREVIQRELQTDSSQISQVLRSALRLLPMEDGQVRIHVNPQDFAELKNLRERHEENWRILEDDSLLPGGCRIETLNSQIDASVETRIQTLMQQLLEQQRHLQSEPPAADVLEDYDFQALADESMTTADEQLQQTQDGLPGIDASMDRDTDRQNGAGEA